MLSMNSSLSFFLALTISIVLYVLRRNSKKFALPPGPPPAPLIGNLLQIPKKYAWKTYAEWCNTYNSDVISFTGFGKQMVVLNSARASTDLLELRGPIYSDRDHNVMLQDLMGTSTIASMSYNDTFRLNRKVINTALNPSAARDYYVIQEKEAYALMERLLQTPDKWLSHLRRTANSVILTVTYAHEVTTDDDYLVTLSERAVNLARQAVVPTSFLVNMVPALKHVPGWLPGVRFKRFALEGRKVLKELEERPFKEVKDRIAAGIVSPSYTTRLLEAKGSITDNSEIDEERLIKSTASIMYGAGSATSVSSVTNLILALVLHPEVQRKAQAEIDTVIGNNRLPTFADQESLPYLEMVLAESLRWTPVVFLGVPHAAHQDDIYNGMFIPKGSVMIPNIWAIMRDEKMYPEPERFWPERFDGRFPDARQPRSFVFGFNRRICPGRHVALNSLFIQAANLLAVYNFSKPRDEQGNEVAPLFDFSEGRAKPFKCTITPRSAAAIALVRSTAAATAA